MQRLYSPHNNNGEISVVCTVGTMVSISNFAPMDYIPATVNLTVYDSGQVKMDKAHFQDFIDDVAAGDIQLNISRVFRLDKIAEAHRFMEDNGGAGKIVVLV